MSWKFAVGSMLLAVGSIGGGMAFTVWFVPKLVDFFFRVAGR